MKYLRVQFVAFTSELDLINQPSRQRFESRSQSERREVVRDARRVSFVDGNNISLQHRASLAVFVTSIYFLDGIVVVPKVVIEKIQPGEGMGLRPMAISSDSSVMIEPLSVIEPCGEMSGFDL